MLDILCIFWYKIKCKTLFYSVWKALKSDVTRVIYLQVQMENYN